MAKRNRNRVNATGRNNTSRFARLDYRILKSNAYRALCPNDRSLLVDIIMLYNGENNGSLYLSVRDAAHRMGVADLSAAGRSFDTLQDLGFIEMTLPSEFRPGSSDRSRARCWRLTWLPGPGRKAPSWEFLDRQPEPQTPARKRMERGLKALKAFGKARDQNKMPVLDSNTIATFAALQAPEPVLDSNTLNYRNGSFPPKPHVTDSATYIATPWGEQPSNSMFGWWKPDWTPKLVVWAFAHSLASIALHETDRGRAA